MFGSILRHAAAFVAIPALTLSAPAMAGDLEVKLVRVKCIKPATGVELDAVRFLEGFVQGGQMVTTMGGPLLSMAGPKGKIAAGVLEGSLTAVETGTRITRLIDSSRSPDDLYVILDDRKVWPSSGGHKEVRGGQSVAINALGSGTGRHTITLMEYDSGSGDDLLGSITFEPARPGLLTFQVVSTEEDSSYLVEVLVSEPPAHYDLQRAAAISGHNREQVKNVTSAECAQVCDARDWCVSFDHHRNTGTCDLSDKSAAQVPLKRDYPGNPYNHYAKKAKSASAPASHLSGYTVASNAAISGHNTRQLSGVSPEDCARVCDTEGWCKSFDYYKAARKCDLSDKSAADVPLKRDYAGNPYDHYSKRR